jgi:hypothetical protein
MLKRRLGLKTLEREPRANPTPTWFRRTMAGTKGRISLTRNQLQEEEEQGRSALLHLW